MVVIPPRCQEERARIAPYHLVQPEAGMIELRRPVEVGHMQMDMAYHRAGGHTSPAHAARALLRGLDDALHIERNRRHGQLPIVLGPSRAGAVGIDLDPQTVWIGEIYRLAHEMIRHPGIGPELLEVAEEAAKRRTLGKEDGEMKEP